MNITRRKFFAVTVVIPLASLAALASTKTVRPEAIADVVARLSMEQAAEAWCELNVWRWPRLLQGFKPAGWDGMTNREKYATPASKATMTLLEGQTTEHAISRRWWTAHLHKTDEAHERWWSETGREWHREWGKRRSN